MGIRLPKRSWEWDIYQISLHSPFLLLICETDGGSVPILSSSQTVDLVTNTAAEHMLTVD